MFDTPALSVLAIEDFTPIANNMRADYDRFFTNPHQHGEAHQVFDYWYVPDIYLYLRTRANKIINTELVESFMDHLRTIGGKIGMKQVSYPYLSIYVNGCHQAIHNDSLNGVYGYVFSLTRWDQRTFTGGETLIAKEGVFDQMEPREPRGRNNFFEVYPNRFNQLILFDDRRPHMVPAIQGSMNPLEARVVLHGHLS